MSVTDTDQQLPAVGAMLSPADRAAGLPEDAPAAAVLPFFTRAATKEYANVRRYGEAKFPPDVPYRARVQSLQTGEVTTIEAAGVEVRGKKSRLHLKSVRVLWVAYGWVNEEGQRLFNPDEPADLQYIGRLDDRITKPIAAKVRELTGEEGDDEGDDEGK